MQKQCHLVLYDAGGALERLMAGVDAATRPDAACDMPLGPLSQRQRQHTGVVACAHIKSPGGSMTNDREPESIGEKGETDSINGKMNEAAGKEAQKQGRKADDPQREAEGKFQKEQGKAQEKLGKAEQKIDEKG
jgi:uncharacterized protein YjbJ (UPF0337 family)